jgi:hypothetical protein
MSNDLLSATFSISSNSPSAYPSAYGALRGGTQSRVRYLLQINEKLDQTDWRVAETRVELQRIMELITEVENAVNVHNRALTDALFASKK